MTSTEIPGYLTKARPVAQKCTLGQSSHRKGKPPLLPRLAVLANKVSISCSARSYREKRCN